eukprot:6210145-Pleurochrysis_carterae.AAC.3
MTIQIETELIERLSSTTASEIAYKWHTMSFMLSSLDWYCEAIGAFYADMLLKSPTSTTQCDVHLQ